MSNRVKGFLITLLVIAIFIGASTPLWVEIVPSGEVGVVYSPTKGVTGEVMNPGWHVKSPLERVVQYPTSVETLSGKDEPDVYTVPTADGKRVKVSLSVSYQFDSSHITELYKRFRAQSGKDIRDSFLKQKVRGWVQEVTSQYTVMDLNGAKRTEINDKITEKLVKEFSAYHIIVDSASINDLELDEETKKQLDKNLAAEQALVQEKKESERKIVEAEREAKIKAINANAEKEAAQAKADAKIIEAEGVAKANKLINDSMTDKIIEKARIDKWNGQYPQVVGGNGSAILKEVTPAK